MRCDRCGMELAPDDEFCVACGQPRPSLAPGFAEVERRLAALRARRQAGELDEATFEAELQQLLVTGPAGGQWMPGADGSQWYWYDGQRWVRRDPPLAGQPERPRVVQPASTAPAPQPAPTAPEGKKRSPWRWVALGLGGLAIVAIVAVAAVFVVPRLLLSLPGAPVSSDAPTPGAQPGGAATLPTRPGWDEWDPVMAQGPDLEVYVPAGWEHAPFEGGASPGLRDPAEIDLRRPPGVDTVFGVAAHPSLHDRMELEIVWYRAPEGRTAEEELDFWQTQIPAGGWGDEFQPDPRETVLGTRCENFSRERDGLRMWVIVIGPTPDGYFVGWFGLIPPHDWLAAVYTSVDKTISYAIEGE